MFGKKANHFVSHLKLRLHSFFQVNFYFKRYQYIWVSFVRLCISKFMFLYRCFKVHSGSYSRRFLGLACSIFLHFCFLFVPLVLRAQIKMTFHHWYWHSLLSITPSPRGLRGLYWSQINCFYLCSAAKWPARGREGGREREREGEPRIESDCSTLLQCSSIHSICSLLNGAPPSRAQTFSQGLML